MEKERDLWRAIPTVLDLQCSWQLLLQSANPRANHTMRTLPPSQSPAYCQAHDEVMCWVKSQPRAKTTPGSFPHCQCEWADWGCVRLRCAPAAFWASWADALPMIAKRNPEVASEVMQKLSACLSSTQLPTHWTGKAFIGDQAGLICTTARDQSAAFGTRASGHTAGSIGASSILDSRFRKLSMLAGCSAARQAHPRSPLRTQLRLCVVSRSNHARVRNCSALVPGVVARAAETARVLDGIHFTSRLILWGTTEPHVSTQVTPRNEPQ